MASWHVYRWVESIAVCCEAVVRVQVSDEHRADSVGGVKGQWPNSAESDTVITHGY